MSSELPKSDVLQLGIKIYGLIGENLRHTTRKVSFYRFFNTIVFGFILYFIIANGIKAKGVALIKTLESAITMIHILAKYIAFMYGKDEINTVIEDRLKFWNPEDVDPKLAQEADRIYGYTKIVQRSLLFAIVTSVQFHMLKPLFNNVDVFPFSVWIVYDSFFLHLAVLAAQYYCLCICTAIVLSYDVTYCSICVHVIIQLRLLKFKISNISNEAGDELKECIAHYQLLGSIFQRIQTIYSLVLLLQYFMSLGMACVQLYILSTGNVDLADEIELVLYMVTMYSEFGYYSIPVEEMSFEFSDIANAAYISSWYEQGPAIRRSLLITMMKAQTPKYLNGGGIIQINIDTFGSVFRKSFSLYLVLKNLIK